MNEPETTKATLIERTPHDPAVQRILEMHGELKPGDIVHYADIEREMYETRNSDRGRAIIAKWKKYLFGENIVLRNVPKVGYEVCDSVGRVLVCGSKELAARRRIRQALQIANNTNQAELTAAQCGYIHHLNRTYTSILLYEGVKPKQLEMPIGK